MYSGEEELQFHLSDTPQAELFMQIVPISYTSSSFTPAAADSVRFGLTTASPYVRTTYMLWRLREETCDPSASWTNFSKGEMSVPAVSLVVL